jgi:hypothetical protein
LNCPENPLTPSEFVIFLIFHRPPDRFAGPPWRRAKRTVQL